MEKSKELNKKAARAGVWYSLGNILLKSIAFFTLPLFGRILTPYDFGIYNTYIAYESILSAILGLGFYSTVKNAKLDYEEDYQGYISSILSINIIVFFIIFIIFNLFYPFYKDFIEFSRTIINILLIHSFGSFIIYFYGAKLNAEFKYKSYIAISFFNTFVNIIFSVIFVLYIFPNEKYIGRIVGSAVPFIIMSLILPIIIYIKGKKVISKKYWIYAISIGIPLIPHVLSQSVLTQFDRIMIQNLIGAEEAGIYSFIYTLSTILIVIQASFNNAWTPWLYLKLKDNKLEEIKKISKEYIKIFSLLTIGFMSIMPEITKLFASKEYWSGIELIVPLSLAVYFIFLYNLPVNIEYYNKKTKYISLGTALAALSNIILNSFMIKKFGYEIAAYTTLISYILLFLFHWYISLKFNVQKIYDIKYILKEIFKVTLVSILIINIRNNSVNIAIRYIFIVYILIYFLKNSKKIYRLIR